ncbi:hypothetical protein N7468_007154 [Penicillium chermesinum]|uniref:Uncharacterized protein n=1 Tax=Penicillium chermesinum TaxID=63820 RepID=A0A9W9NTN9_9EURO|nr:uncharacterized protein N7468_007154 [Penicillium chermesinum]KAJ5225929.1 hypothetical protein N7468_007154 [Penicillium chermesinum]
MKHRNHLTYAQRHISEKLKVIVKFGYGNEPPIPWNYQLTLIWKGEPRVNMKKISSVDHGADLNDLDWSTTRV